LTEFYDSRDRRYLYPFTNCTNCGVRFSAIIAMPYDRAKTTMADFPLCKECLREYKDPLNRRFHAQTTSCPACGPHYTLELYSEKAKQILQRLSNNPEDEFIVLLKDIVEKHPNNEETSGRKIVLKYDVSSMFKIWARLLERGCYLLLKGWGGFHLCCSTGVVKEFREWYGRPSKPFAIIARDIDTVRKIVSLGKREEGILQSPARPIVLLNKKEHADVNLTGRFFGISEAPKHKIKDIIEDISPGLPNIGIMLPCSPAHHLIFRYLKDDFFILTSANIPGEPIVIDDAEAERLKADAALVHNRRIYNRCDDSVVRIHDFEDFCSSAKCQKYSGSAPESNGNPPTSETMFIRFSRGFTPHCFELTFLADNQHSKDVKQLPSGIAAGAMLHLACGIVKEGRAYNTQHLGDSDSYDVLRFAFESLERLSYLHGLKRLDYLAIDIHPAYPLSRRIRQMFLKHRNRKEDTTGITFPEFTEGVELFEVQHHHAHALSLMAENRIPPEGKAVVVVLDGTGYGTDGTIWGSEVLEAGYDSFEQIAHLKSFPLPGGDYGVLDLRRFLASVVLSSAEGVCGNEKVKTTQDLEKGDGIVEGNDVEDVAKKNKTRVEKDETAVKAVRYIHSILPDDLYRALLSQLRGGSVLTRGAGRYLDALSCFAGTPAEVSYEGEGAMRFETILQKYKFSNPEEAKEVLKKYNIPYPSITSSDRDSDNAKDRTCYEIDPGPTFVKLASIRRELAEEECKVVSSAVAFTLVGELFRHAIDHAIKRGLKVGFTGGVAYNSPLYELFLKMASAAGVCVLRHCHCPPGDAGVWLGQAAYGFFHLCRKMCKKN
ncbi:MAG: Sua5/YciO/YrdC/YwlC family protein, partial [Thermoplasmata archaeon]